MDKYTSLASLENHANNISYTIWLRTLLLLHKQQNHAFPMCYVLWIKVIIYLLLDFLNKYIYTKNI